MVEVEVFHDESKEEGYWHGMFVVPKQVKSFVINHLKKSRNESGFDSSLSLKEYDEGRGKKFRCIRSWISKFPVFIASSTGDSIPYLTGGRGQNFHYDESVKAPYCKFIVFREKDDHKKLSDLSYKDRAQKIEVTIRMGLKGGVHALYPSDEQVKIQEVYMDGWEHHKRKLRVENIVKHEKEWGENISFRSGWNRIKSVRSDHSVESEDLYGECQIIQFCDLVIGLIRKYCSSNLSDNERTLFGPVRCIIERMRQGAKRMSNSRFENGLIGSEAWIELGKWKFDNLFKNSRENRKLPGFPKRDN